MNNNYISLYYRDPRAMKYCNSKVQVWFNEDNEKHHWKISPFIFNAPKVMLIDINNTI